MVDSGLFPVTSQMCDIGQVTWCQIRPFQRHCSTVIENMIPGAPVPLPSAHVTLGTRQKGPVPQFPHWIS